MPGKDDQWWSITVDQISQAGKSQRYGPYNPVNTLLGEAIEEALILAGLDMVEAGQYQITVTRRGEI